MGKRNNWGSVQLTNGLTEMDQKKVGMSDSLSKRLAETVLPDASGKEIRLGSLWEKQTAVVVFLRHYG
jgi:hypothetical protein